MQAELLISMQHCLTQKTAADIPEYMGCINRVGENQKRTKVFWSMSGNVWFFGFPQEKPKKNKKPKFLGPCLEMFGFLVVPRKKQKNKKTSFFGPCMGNFGFSRKKQKTKVSRHGPKNFVFFVFWFF